MEVSKIPVKTIVSGYATPTIGKKKCTFSEYEASEVKGSIKLKVTFVITIIPGEGSMPLSTLMATGFPVMPEFADDVHVEPSLQDIGSNTMLPKSIVDEMNMALRRHDQWLNLPHNQFKTDDGKFLTNRRDFPDIVQVTKFGVEFEDVEFLRDNHGAKYKLLYNIGIKFLAKTSGVPIREVVEWWSTMPIGPSITHSSVIRVQNSQFNGAKPFDRTDLLVRYVLSRMFSVGQGSAVNVQFDGISQPVRLPQSIHLLNAKRAEALMLPLCVTKVGIIVYSLSSGLAKLLEHVDLNNEEMSDSYLNTFYKKSVPRRDTIRSRQPMARTDDVDERPLFMSQATPILVTNGGRPSDSRFTLVFPSGLEFSVSSIISDIAHQMRTHKTISMRNENAVVWHPNFAIIVSQTVKRLGSMRTPKRTYHAVVLPAARKSRVAPPFRNVDNAVRDSVTDPGQLVHYARLTESFGYIGGLGKALKALKQQ
jgi:hypothetical protein